ncbi:ylmG homolog protein 2, chloroplastic [Mangifera indica]|uniref:ylmG homolog protein 2, chloroplastic n=1 Tax=Mangifera indica TaxID=29780 RepID=UPI001CFA9099|nr:ylmG homolog protein 2, chloroplastic [Mangifera indica]
MAPNESSTENRKCRENQKSMPNSIILSSAFLQTPFAHPFFRPSLPKPSIITHPHTLIISTADKFFAFIQSLAFQNPLIRKFHSLSSELHSFCHQVRSRNCIRVNPLSNHNFAAVLPGDSVAGVVVANGILNFLNLYNTLLVVRLVLTWFPNSPPAIVSPLSTLCDPYLNIFRGIIPPLGGTLDLSPILAFLVLNAFTSTAAALPCELPAAGSTPLSPSFAPRFTHLTITQQKWLRRLCGSQEKSSSNVN